MAVDPVLYERAHVLDATDPLGHLRERFVKNDGLVYLDGNSLGPPLSSIGPRLTAVFENDWAKGLITSWAAWIELQASAAARLSPLIGAGPGEVTIADSTSVNLYKAIFEAALLARGRNRLVIDGANFPTDLYVARSAFSHARGGKGEVTTVEDPGALAEALADDVAVVTFTHVDFRTGAMHDLASLVEHAHALGVLVVVDLCHTTGTMPVGFDALMIDFAVGCGYKFLNGGPGAPGFIAVAERHSELVTSPIPGWWGSEDPFAMLDQYRPSRGIGRQQAGTPGIFSLVALEEALSVYEGVDLGVVREKVEAMTSLFVECLESGLDEGSYELVSPRDARLRGAQVSLRHEKAARIMAQLKGEGVLGDLRPPEICRFGFSPLPLCYEEVVTAAERVVEVVEGL